MNIYEKLMGIQQELKAPDVVLEVDHIKPVSKGEC